MPLLLCTAGELYYHKVSCISRIPDLQGQIWKKVYTMMFEVPLKFYLYINKGKQTQFENTVHSGCGKLLYKRTWYIFLEHAIKCGFTTTIFTSVITSDSIYIYIYIYIHVVIIIFICCFQCLAVFRKIKTTKLIVLL